ncbi:RodZ domain-containing protein [Streptomonospora nanhaiensis]|uniref:Cytoskeleton protein RodZ-like C-terminal domain-containing protein n=1 Tax=Streptomonospora nanhaiensis TaxID=1323731 RepID=A0A853BQG5_9ACTN|nr:hypothetical protein [Streptomonospora nanhaiensis]
MGRHRNDPRGIGQMLAIAGAIVLFITLVILGGYFLYRSLPAGNPDSAVPESADTAAAQAGEVTTGTLYIEVVGESSDVLVRVPGGDVLTDAAMGRGEYVTFDESRPLSVTIGDPSAVELYVHGEPRDISGEEPGHTFTVEP